MAAVVEEMVGDTSSMGGAPGEVGEAGTSVGTESNPSTPTKGRVLNRHERSELLRAKLKEKGFNHNSVQRKRLPFNP